MKCEYCDNPVPDGATRCPSCGAAAEPEQGKLQEIKQEPSHEQASTPLPMDPYMYMTRKSRVAYIVLGVLFGQIGVHNFYAGYIGRGVAQLLITILSFGLLCWISWIWAIIEICAIEHDGRGVPFD